MSVPAGISTVTVTGKYLAPDGTPLSGVVVFTPSIKAADSTDKALLPPIPYKVTLDANGSFSVALMATDDPQWVTPGWTYSVLEQITNAQGVTKKSTYNISVPASPSTLDLSAAFVVDLPGTPSQYLLKAGGTMTGDVVLASGVKLSLNGLPVSKQDNSVVINGTGSVIDASALPYGYGSSGRQGLSLPSYRPSDDIAGGTDGTSRINLYSKQRNGTYSFGEVVRAFGLHKDSKQMIAWYAPTSGYDGTTREPQGTVWKPVTWIGSHWESNGHTGNHKHWEIEIPDITGALQGRFEILYGNQADETIGLDKTLILTNLADFVVRATGTDSSSNPQVQVLRISGAAGNRKDIQFSNDVAGANPRWTVGVNSDAESGTSAGSDFEIRRYNDSNALVDTLLKLTRAGNGTIQLGTSTSSNTLIPGRVNIGTTTASTQKLYIEDGTATNFLAKLKATVAGTATTAIMALESSDNTKRLFDARVTGANLPHVQMDYATSGGGQLALSDGTNVRAKLYWSAASKLGTDSDFAVETAGKGLRVKEGSNAKQGVSTLVAGTLTVANTSVTSTSRIMLTAQSLGTVTAPKTLAVTARTAGTSFTITSADNTDTSVVAWQIFEPA